MLVRLHFPPSCPAAEDLTASVRILSLSSEIGSKQLVTIITAPTSPDCVSRSNRRMTLGQLGVGFPGLAQHCRHYPRRIGAADVSQIATVCMNIGLALAFDQAVGRSRRPFPHTSATVHPRTLRESVMQSGSSLCQGCLNRLELAHPP